MPPVQVLGSRLGGVRIIDRTYMKDRYNFVLEFVLDENAPGLPGGELPAPPDRLLRSRDGGVAAAARRVSAATRDRRNGSGAV
jgi:hypothetical protein